MTRDWRDNHKYNKLMAEQIDRNRQSIKLQAFICAFSVHVLFFSNFPSLYILLDTEKIKKSKIHLYKTRKK